MKLLVCLLCIMAFTMSVNAASMKGLPDGTVSLSGLAENPTITNNGGKDILCVVLLTNYQNEVPVSHPREDGIKAGASFTRHTYARRVNGPAGVPIAITGVAIDSVIYADGQFVGPDASGSFADLVKHFAAKKIGVHR